MPLTLLKIPHSIKNSGPSTMAAPSSDLIQALLGFPSAAGKPVTRATAIRVAAVLASVKTLANDIAKMPLILRETKEVNGRQRTQPAIDNPLYTILKDIPNRWQTSFQLRWYLVSQLIMNGNCYCQKLTNQAGDIVELVPLNAWSMSITWDYDAPLKSASGDQITTIDPRTGKKVPTLRYRYMDGNSVLRDFYQPDLWHVTATNIEGNGFEGAPLIALGKEAISVLIAAEETAGRNFANGLGMGGFISFPVEGGPDEEQAQNIVDRLKKDFSGSQNAGKFTIIPHGGKWEKMTFNAKESQLIESRQWNEQEVARLFGGAPLIVKLGLSQQSSTYASSTAFLDDYFTTSLLPYTTVIEQTIVRDLIAPEDRGKLYAKHNANIILRGSPEDRAKTNQARIQSFQMTPNEARADEDLDSVEGGDFLTGGTGTPVIFNPETQEWFIPGQQPPASGEGADDPNAPEEPDTEGDDDKDVSPAKPKKPNPPVRKPSKTVSREQGLLREVLAQHRRLEQIAVSLAERVMRKEGNMLAAGKGGIVAQWIAEVLNVPMEQAEDYVAKRPTLTDEEARAALIALAQGEQDED